MRRLAVDGPQLHADERRRAGNVGEDHGHRLLDGSDFGPGNPLVQRGADFDGRRRVHCGTEYDDEKKETLLIVA